MLYDLIWRFVAVEYHSGVLTCMPPSFFKEKSPTVWHCVCNYVSSNFKFFFLLKLSAVCTF